MSANYCKNDNARHLATSKQAHTQKWKKKGFSFGEPLDMIEAFTDNGVNQVRTRTNDEATDSRGTGDTSEAQDQSCKNSHGVETYKFFQNWLRVPDGVPVPAYIPGNRECALMGNGSSKNPLKITTKIHTKPK